VTQQEELVRELRAQRAQDTIQQEEVPVVVLMSVEPEQVEPVQPDRLRMREEFVGGNEAQMRRNQERGQNFTDSHAQRSRYQRAEGQSRVGLPTQGAPFPQPQVTTPRSLPSNPASPQSSNPFLLWRHQLHPMMFPSIQLTNGDIAFTSVGGDLNNIDSSQHIVNTNSGNTTTTITQNSNNDSSIRTYDSTLNSLT
jgi:hypothetical protein